VQMVLVFTARPARLRPGAEPLPADSVYSDSLARGLELNWLSQHSGPAVPASHGDTAAGPEADGRTPGRAAELRFSVTA
jgi:hypothetical protein